MHDFEVKYRFLSVSEGGRQTGAPFQGYKCDWAYQGDDVDNTGIYMIWPQFEDGHGRLVEKDVQVLVEGTARMSIASEEMKNTIHRKRIKVGVKGFFMEVKKRVAEAIVTRICDL